MPFTTPEKRKKVDTLTEEEVRNILLTYKSVEAGFNVGDKCYYFYKKMMGKWNKERRWTIAHNIYKTMRDSVKQNFMDIDSMRAYELAWQVFFQLQVMPYELEKQTENGDITGEQQMKGSDDNV